MDTSSSVPLRALFFTVSTFLVITSGESINPVSTRKKVPMPNIITAINA